MSPIQQPTKDSQYIQQHLANERTFLAWIRVSATTIGLGFIAAKIHFFSPQIHEQADLYAQLIGVFSVVFGLFTIVFATLNYFRKRIAINNQTFLASIVPVWVFATGFFLICLLFFMYFVLM